MCATLEPVADSWFLKIDGIEGESTDERHRGEIDVLEWSWGVAQPNARPGSGAASGRPTFQDFEFVARISKASPTLFASCATGAHHRSAVLSGVHPGAQSQPEFLRYELTDVLVTAVHHDDDQAAVPTERFSLSYRRIQMTYRLPSPTGGPSAPIQAGFDLAQHTQI